MPNVKGLLADPEFNKLDPGAQRHVLGQVDPQFEQLSDADYQMFRQKVGPQAESLPEGVNYGKDTSGQGFWAHATQTLRDLPDAVLSGRILTGIPSSMAQGMQNYIQNPSIRNAINTVPGLGPMLTRPFDTWQSGDSAGAMGDAVDIGGQLLAGRALGAIPRVPEPIQPVEQPLGPGLSTPPGPPTLPPIPAGLRTVADWTLPVPHRVQQLAGHAYEYARGKSGAPAKTTETRMMDVRPFDTSTSDVPSPPPPVVDNSGFKAGQYDAPKIQRPPVQTGGGHVPDYQHPGPSPEEILQKIAADKKAKMNAAPTPTTPAPAAKPATPTVAPPPAPMASSAEQSLPGGRAVVGEGQIPVRQHETNVKVDEQIKNKVNNLAEYLRSKGGTPEHLDMIVKDPQLTKQYLREAHAYGTNRGNPVPKTGYKGLDPGSDSHMAVRQRILDMIEEEKNKP